MFCELRHICRIFEASLYIRLRFETWMPQNTFSTKQDLIATKHHTGTASLATVSIAVGCLIYAIRFGDPFLKSFLLYNLPDGLWAFGFAGLLLSINRLQSKLAWLSTLALIGVSGELLQYYRIIPGTFDYLDILCYFGGIALALLCHQFLHHKTHKP